MHPPSPHELLRGHLPHPSEAGRQAPFFHSTQAALHHLRDHVLTAPECEGWMVVSPPINAHLDLTDGRQRAAYVQAAEQSGGPSAQPVFDLYRQAAADACRDAATLNWHATLGRDTVALGTSGVFVLLEDGCVQTAYLPGQGSAEAVQTSRTGLPGVLPRDRGLMRRRPDRADRERRAQDQREGQWSDQERLYYRVYRPAVQFIRRRYHSNVGLDGRVRQAEGLLKAVLPTMSQLSLDDWRMCRARVSPGGTA